MYLDRSSATKRLKRTTREHHLLLVRLHCLWHAHKDIQIQSWALRTQGMTQQWTFLCIFYSRSTFIQVTWKEELLRFYTWVIIWVRRTSSKKCPQQLFAVPGKQKKQFQHKITPNLQFRILLMNLHDHISEQKLSQTPGRMIWNNQSRNVNMEH